MNTSQPSQSSFDLAPQPVSVQTTSPTGEAREIRSTPYQRGSGTSKAAAVKAEKFVAEQGWRVLSWIEDQGERGATQKEAAAALKIGRPSLCARFRALEQASEILKVSGVRRSGCAVYRTMRSV